MNAFIESETEASGDGVSSLRETPAVDYREELIDHIPDLRRYARSLAFSHDDADELLQDCLERALSRLHLLREDSNLKSWAFTIMHNIYCNRVRSMAPACSCAPPRKHVCSEGRGAPARIRGTHIRYRHAAPSRRPAAGDHHPDHD